jgi:hypothetical protein
MKPVHGLLIAAAAVLLATVAVRPVRADDIDPTVFVGGSTTALNGSGFSTITEGGDSWTYKPATGGDTNTTWLSFENTSSSAWTALTIVATMDSTSGHSFTCDTTPFPVVAGGSPAFSSCTDGTPTSTTETYTFTGGSIGVDDYLVFDWNSFPTGSGDLSFAFNATPAATPEPSSFALLGIGLIALLGLAGFVKRRQAGLVSA